MYSTRSTKKDVITALKSLEVIKRPDGDNEYDSINSTTVYPYLSQKEQALVDHAEQITNEYVRKQGQLGDKPNQRSLTELTNAGFDATLGQDQDDPCRLVGNVAVGEWTLDISDSDNSPSDD